MAKGKGFDLVELVNALKALFGLVKPVVETLAKLATELLDILRKRQEAKTEKESAAADDAYRLKLEEIRARSDEARARTAEAERDKIRLQLELESLRQKHAGEPTERTRVAVEETETKVAEQARHVEAAAAIQAATDELVEAADAEDEGRIERVARGLLLA